MGGGGTAVRKFQRKGNVFKWVKFKAAFQTQTTYSAQCPKLSTSRVHISQICLSLLDMFSNTNDITLSTSL
jgi:hypothetical protein